MKTNLLAAPRELRRIGKIYERHGNQAQDAAVVHAVDPEGVGQFWAGYARACAQFADSCRRRAKRLEKP